jgi:iron complex outermembrane receptor protein
MTQSLIKRSRFALLLATTATLAFVTAADSAETQRQVSDIPANGQSNDLTNIAEVVVTANKREEKVQDVAGAVAVQSGALLQDRHQLQLADYANYVPGLNVGNGGKAGLSSVNLRGIASVSSTASVGAYLDETPMGGSSRWGYAQNTILDVLPYDLDRLEVLSGPQGTLYGAGSMGGLIKYVLKTPSLTSQSATVGADVGVIDGAGDMSYSVRGVVNMPIIQDKLAVRISLFDQSTPGFVDNAYNKKTDVNGQSQDGARLAVYWKPAESLSVKLSILQTHNSARDSGTISYAKITTATAADGASTAIASAPYGDLTQYHVFPQKLNKSIALYSANVNWNAPAFDVISATSWSRTKMHTTVDNTLVIAPLISFGLLPAGALADSSNNYHFDKFTQEIRLVSPEGQSVEWLAGGFYTYERGDDGGPVGLYLANRTKVGNLLEQYQFYTYSEYAAFGDLTWHVSDKLDLTGGLRHAKNNQKYTNNAIGGILGAPKVTTYAPASEAVTTWSASARYQFAPDAMVYARVATGYRPGGPNSTVLNTPTPPPAVTRADTLTSYETGIKSEFMEKRLLVNLSAFYIDWKDVQLNATVGGNTYLSNGGSAVSKGLELTTAYFPVTNLKLGLTAAYTDSSITKTAPGAFFIPGYQLPGVPELSSGLTADYNWDMPNDWTARLGGGVRWVDKQWLTGVQYVGKATPAVQAPSYTLLNMNGSLTKGRYNWKVYGTNLTNERAVQGGLALIDIFNTPRQGDFWIVQPRAFGIGLDLSF